MKSSRLNRINVEVRELISEIIQYELNDPRINGIITVLKVEVDNELEYAKTYVSIFNSKDEAQTFEALQSCASYIRKLLSKRLMLRTVPAIKFILDKGNEYQEHIEKILSTLDIRKDEDDNTESEN